MTIQANGYRPILRCCLTLLPVVAFSLSSGCDHETKPTSTDTTNPDQPNALPSGTAPDKASIDQGEKENTPTQSPKVSSEEATSALKKLGATFQQEPDLGGLFIDFGLIRGEFPNDKLKQLHAIPDIAVVRLPEGVTDAGLANLKGLSSLKSLAITGNNISDAGLEHLSGLTTLESVVIWSNKVTDAGVERLKQGLPKCKVKVNR